MTTSPIVREAPNLVALLNKLAGDNTVLPDRARGVLTGLAVGNLLGLPVEGMSAASIAREYSDGVTEINSFERLRPMDDDLAQAADLGEALVAGGDYINDFARRLVRWRRNNGRGIGITTSAVIGLLEEGHPPPEAGRIIYEERDHVAPNGGLMRCAPVALARHSNQAQLVRDSAATCAVTHFAPTCQWSCVILNAAIALLLKGIDPPIQYIIEAGVADGVPVEIQDWAMRVSEDIGDLALDQGQIGHTLLCLQTGLWAMKTSLDLETALVQVVSAGGDTDTNGAVVGAVLGARYGIDAIPRRWAACVPQRERLDNLAVKLLVAAP